MTSSTPRLAKLLLQILLRGERREVVLGDIEEEFSQRLPTYGESLARRWYWSQALRSVGTFGRLAEPVWRRRRPSGRGGFMGMHSLSQDLGYATRKLKAAPSFTAIALITLALGIGANTAIFSVLNGVVFTPSPYPEADRLVRVWRQLTFSKGLLDRFEEETRSFVGLSGTREYSFALTDDGEPEELAGAGVSVSHFNVVGVQPVIGRGFTTEEEVPGQGRVVVLSYRLWQRRFAADPDVLGRRISLGSEGEDSWAVVGVMPEGYRPLSERWDLWVPLTMDPTNFPDYQGTASLMVIGRVAPAATLEQANEEVHALAVRVQEESSWISPENAALAGVMPVHDALVGDARPRLLVLFAAVGLVLLIACGNVANLLLARGAVRHREVAMRLALGASRIRVVRQLLVESALLGILGGALGLAVALWAVPTLVGYLPSNVPMVDHISIDSRVLAFTLAVSIGASFVFGLLPAIRITRPAVQQTLKQGARAGTVGIGRQRINSGLAVAEAAIAVVLVVGAGLMIKSFWRLHRVDPGFNAEQLLTLRTSPSSSRYSDDESLQNYYAAVMEQIEAVPGVLQVAMINLLPMTGSNTGMLWEVEGHPWPEGTPMPRANSRSVSPGYFGMMGVPLLQGREFDAADRGDAEPVMIVNESMAAVIDPQGDVLGKRIGGFAGETYLRVVGIVSDVHQHRLDLASRPEMYFPFALWSSSKMYLLVRTTGDAGEALPAVQQAIWNVDADVPIARSRTMEEVIGRTLASSRLLTGLLTAFGILALALGAIGLYGVMSYTVSQRTHEIGIRMALGAGQGNVLTSTVGRGVLLAGLGVAIGLAGALAASRVLSAYLYGVSTTDPVVFATVAASLVLSAVLASYLPARRASKVDPMLALRSE